MQIRRSKESERAAISAIASSALEGEQGQEIAHLVDGLLDDATAAPLLSLVAEVDGRLVGHILFTAVKLATEQRLSAKILAPLAVSRDYQGKGVGSALINEGLKELAETGVGLVFVLGHPGYYIKFGFRPAHVLGFEAPYPIPSENADAWMVQELVPGIIGSIEGTIQCSEVLNHPQHWLE